MVLASALSKRINYKDNTNLRSSVVSFLIKPSLSRATFLDKNLVTDLGFNLFSRQLVKRKFSVGVEKLINIFIGEKAIVYLSLNLRRNSRRNLRSVLFRNKRGLMKLFILSLSRMEPGILLKLLSMHLNSMHFFRHRLVVKRYILPIMYDIINNNYLAGFYYLISGKLSVGGNARKRKLDIHWGLHARSKS